MRAKERRGKGAKEQRKNNIAVVTWVRTVLIAQSLEASNWAFTQHFAISPQSTVNGQQSTVNSPNAHYFFKLRATFRASSTIRLA